MCRGFELIDSPINEMFINRLMGNDRTAKYMRDPMFWNRCTAFFPCLDYGTSKGFAGLFSGVQEASGRTVAMLQARSMAGTPCSWRVRQNAQNDLECQIPTPQDTEHVTENM